MKMFLKTFVIFVFLIASSFYDCAFAIVSVSFQPNSSSTVLNLRSTISQNIGTFNYYSDGTLGCDIVISSLNNSKMQRGSSTDRISYTMSGSIDGILLQTSAPSRTISIATSSVVDVTQILSFTSNGIMDNPGLNPFQLVAGTYSDTITVNIITK